MSDQPTNSSRGQWGSRAGFILAAAGSAVGLGNIWKFPYITGENGGGLFVLVYLVAILLVGLPIMMAEIFVGRTTQKSPVGAIRDLSKRGSPWIMTGWLGVLAAFVILSYYSVVAGWAMHYTWITMTEPFTGQSADEISSVFGAVFGNTTINTGWHVAFMVITIGIVSMGIHRGIELCAKILMPTLFLILIALLIYAMTTDGFGRAAEFLFAPNTENFSGKSVLEALGHAFFTLSLGMGAMITYGSYLSKKESIVSTSIIVSILDTAVALMACLILFPIIFSANLEPGAGPGLVFVSIPIAFSQMSGGAILAPLFFLLLTFAALTSAISLLEVAASYFIDELKWPRLVAVLVTGFAITLIGIPSALSGGTAMFGSGFQELNAPLLAYLGHENGLNWFDLFDYIASNWLLPLGGLAIALFASWRVGGAARQAAFCGEGKGMTIYFVWLILLRFLVPIAVILVFLNAVGFLDWFFALFATAVEGG